MISPSRVPKSVRVGGETFAIAVEHMDDWGLCKWDTRKISVSYAALKSRELLRATLFHELCHASFMVSGHGWAEKFDEEPIIRSLEHLLLPAWDTLDAKLKKL